jgi:hypothetical protein
VIENQFEQAIQPVAVSENASVAGDGSGGDPLLLEIGRLEPGDSEVVDIEYEGLSVDGNANMLFTVTSAEEVTATDELAIRVEPEDGSNDTRGNDQTVPRFDSTPVPGSSNPGTGPSGEPPIGIPGSPDELGPQSGLGILMQSTQQPISAARGDEAPVRFRVTNNDTFVHENVNVSIALPDGLLYSNFDPQNSGLSTANNVYEAVPQVDFNTRRTLRPGESLEGVLYVTGKNPGEHPVKVLTQSNQTGVLERTDFVNVAQ